ncbi:MAG: malto-oligosyltrehalose synthase [Elusimicrobia bacterium]|nr:malto-oligosyltrehalose synthase [Elusimicrobiota bacterium]
MPLVGPFSLLARRSVPTQESRLRVPGATYRLQLHAGFNFRDAEALADYLADLGVTACYASPIFKARAGSPHGYDVTDPDAFNPELGGERGFHRWAETLRRRGLGLIADVVPNHMGTDKSNRWWMDVLEKGPGSKYAAFFDIDWRPPKRELYDKVLLPILGEQYGRALESQRLRVEYRRGVFVVRYGDVELPLAARTWPNILGPAVQEARSSPDGRRVADALQELSAACKSTANGGADRGDVGGRVEAFLADEPAAARAVGRVLERINGRRGDARSFDALERLLADQYYRLSYWRVAADEVNYRRFFDVSELVALRVEQPRVFDAVHHRLLSLIRQGLVTGVRVDHVDGLYDPEEYLRRLGLECRRAAGSRGQEPSSFYVVAEKILLNRERLRSTWSVHGTTGYDFLNCVNGLFVHPAGARLIDKGYRRFIRSALGQREVLRDCKRMVLRVSMSSEMHMLAARLDRISEQHRWSRDFTLEGLRFALREVLACFPVYRTYTRPEGPGISAEDRESVLSAVREAKRLNPATDESIFEFIASVLLREDPPGITESQRTYRRDFLMRLQQVTGSVMAKSLEDTAFYRRYPLASLNEVGGDPERFGVSIGEAHAAAMERQASWPGSLSATATHDTKRGEDVRLRIDALSEIPAEWISAVLRWERMNRGLKERCDGDGVPDANEEYLLYQTLVGSWPMGKLGRVERREFIGRIQAYMLKAMHEAKVTTSWIRPNRPREEAVLRFIGRLLRPEHGAFLDDFLPFQRRVSDAAMLGGLSQTLIKIAFPGVPDFYQGSELWDLSLVDPDNRRPVDFEGRRRLLRWVKRKSRRNPGKFLEEALRSPEAGAPKLFLISKGLELRGRERQLFAGGRYVPIRATGADREHVFAFARVLGDKAVLAVAGRFFLRLGAGGRPSTGQAWGDTALVLPAGLPGGVFRDALTGRQIERGRSASGSSLALADVFATAPAALLETVS